MDARRTRRVDGFLIQSFVVVSVETISLLNLPNRKNVLFAQHISRTEREGVESFARINVTGRDLRNYIKLLAPIAIDGRETKVDEYTNID